MKPDPVHECLHIQFRVHWDAFKKDTWTNVGQFTGENLAPKLTTSDQRKGRGDDFPFLYSPQTETLPLSLELLNMTLEAKIPGVNVCN